jgi:hypothetical protein
MVPVTALENGSGPGRTFFVRRLNMLPTRWSVTCVASLAFASGCPGCSQTTPELHPVLNERGLITYRYMTTNPDNRPEAPPAKEPDRVSPLGQELQADAENQQRLWDEMADQNNMSEAPMPERMQEIQWELEEQAKQDSWRVMVQRDRKNVGSERP